MSLKKSISQALHNRSEMIRVYYVSAKILFIIVAFAFFISYVALTSGFYGEVFLPYFLPLYVTFVLCTNIFMGASILYVGQKRVPFPLLLLLLVVPLACIGLFLYPVI